MMATYGADPRKWKANGCCNDEAAIQETVRHSINMRKLDEMDAEIVNNLQAAVDNPKSFSEQYHDQHQKV